MGAVFWGKVGEFIAAIFIGTASTQAAYVFAVNVARLAVLALIAKVTAPKLDFSQKATEKLLTLTDPIAAQTFIYGEDMISGPLIFANTAGLSDKDLYKVVALLGHECDSVISYRIDSTDIPLSDLSGAFDGTVDTGVYAGVAEVEFKFGTSTQSLFTLLSISDFSALFNAVHTGRGWTMMTWKFSIVEGLEDAFNAGVPRNLRAVIRGKKVFDPRKYALNADPGFANSLLDTDSGRKTWWGDNAQTAVLDPGFVIPTAGILKLDNTDADTEDVFSERISVDTSKRYTVRVDVKQLAGDRVNILAVAFYDSGGSLITPGAETGWANLGANYFEFFASAVFTGAFVEEDLDFGSGGTAQIPAGAVTMAMVAELSGAGTTATTLNLRDYAIHEDVTANRHDLDDDTTWEWSDNPAVCLADFIRWDKFGMKEVDERIDWPLTIDAAQICDELVAIPTAATQKRYTLNAVFSSIESRGDVRDQILGSMMGRMVFSQGLWRIWAGAAIVPDVTLTEANLGGAIQLQASAGAKERYNRVRGKFVDPSRDYTANSYPEQRSATFVTDDGGEVRPQIADMLHTNNTFEAQRKAIIFLKQSRNQRLVVFQGNYSCFRIQPGTTVLLDTAEYGFAGEKFFVTEWAFTEDGVQLTMLQEVDSVWADPIEADYTVRSETGALVFGETGVPAPTSPTAVPTVGGVLVCWTDPPASLFDHVEVHMAFENVRASATIVASAPSGDECAYDLTADVNRLRYYWLRAVDSRGRVSDFEPDLTTTTVTSYSGIAQPGVVRDPLIRLGSAGWVLTCTGGSCVLPTYDVGSGTKGTDTIDFAGSAIKQKARHKIRRGDSEWDVEALQGMAVEVRFRVKYSVAGSGGWNVSFIPQIVTSDDADANGRTYAVGPAGVVDFDENSTVGTWEERQFIFVLDEEDLETAKPRFISIHMLVDGNSNSAEYQMDMFDAAVVGRVFTGESAAGFVPESLATQKYSVLMGNAEWAAPPLFKAATESVNNSVAYQDDDDLVAALAINKHYAFELHAVIACTSTTPDFMFQFTGPTGSAGFMTYQAQSENSDTWLTNPHRVNVYNTTNLIPITANIDVGLIIRGTVETGGTSGDLTFRWAQNVATAIDTQVLLRSYMILTELGDA